MTSIRKAFSMLGEEIREYVKSPDESNTLLSKGIRSEMQPAFHENGWFTKENVLMSLDGISSWLHEDVLEKWIGNYEISDQVKSVGIIMAGNIPLVGFHDFMTTLLSENKALVKMSSTDKKLLPVLTKRLIELEPSLRDRIEFVDRLKNYDAVIATGSNNTARYFEYYFREKPHIIRKNRNSVAVIKGHESDKDLRDLGRDIFSYYGLGCRNVSKMLIPEEFELDRFFHAMVDYHEVAMNKKYANNYDYYKAFYLLNKANLLENGFLLLKEDPTLHSPVSMLFYQRYQNQKEVHEYLELEKDNIQCIVSCDQKIDDAVPIGKSQFPDVDDYADGVDTMNFLSKI